MVRYFLIPLAFIIYTATVALADSKEYSIFDVRRTFAMKDSDPIYRDYYINMGSDNGLQVGDTLSVKRHVPIIDSYKNKAQGDMIVQIAKIKVIHSQPSMSVARTIAESSYQNIPVVQFEQIMMGDRVELVSRNAETEPTPVNESQKKTDEKTEVKGGVTAPGPAL